MNNQLQTQPKFSIAIQTNAYKKLINNTLGDSERAKRFIASISSAVATNPNLQKCDAGSIVSAALLGEALNLSPSPQLGQYYLVPFEKKEYNRETKKWEVIGVNAQFQIGYKGYIQLAIRSGQYKDIDVIEIREGEYIGRDKLTGKHQFNFIENEVEREERPVIGYLAYFEYLNGFYKNIYWTKEKMQKHALEYSQAYSSDIKNKTNYSYWSKDFNGMSFKTMLRQLISKWGVMSIEMQEAFNKDMTVLKTNGDYDYVDNQPTVSTPTVEEINNEEKEEKTEIKQVNINEI